MVFARCCSVLMLALAIWPTGAQSPRIARPHATTPLLIAPAAEQPVQLQRALIEGEVQAGVAQTRITLEFHNPNRRVLEGELQFPLTDGQQISGFALDINDELRDAVPVPKDRGRQVFEEIARRGVDPGLLEQTAGNQFRLRIYPLPAGGNRRVQLVIREPLAFAGQGWQWTLPLQFAAGAASVELKLQAPGAATAGTAPFRINAGHLHWQGRGAQLPAQLQWSLPAARQAQVQVARWQDGHYLLAQLPVAVSRTPRTLPSEIGLLWDGSGSSGQRDRAREFALLDRYFAAMGDGTVALTVLRDRAEKAGCGCMLALRRTACRCGCAWAAVNGRHCRQPRRVMTVNCWPACGRRPVCSSSAPTAEATAKLCNCCHSSSAWSVRTPR